MAPNVWRELTENAEKSGIVPDRADHLNGPPGPDAADRPPNGPRHPLPHGCTASRTWRAISVYVSLAFSSSEPS